MILSNCSTPSIKLCFSSERNYSFIQEHSTEHSKINGYKRRDTNRVFKHQNTLKHEYDSQKHFPFQVV